MKDFVAWFHKSGFVIVPS